MATEGVAPPPVTPAAGGTVEAVGRGRPDRRQAREERRRGGPRPAAARPAENQAEDVEEIGPRSPSGRLDVLA
jgi:hypothetical protein